MVKASKPKKTKNLGGRPPIKITKALCKKAERLAAQGLTQEQIASVLGMGKTTLYDKQAKYPEFSNAIQSGRDKGIKEVTNALFQKAKKGDVSAQKYFLNNRDNPNWKDRTENTLQGPNGGPIEITDISKLTDAQLDARIAKLQSND